MSVGLGVFCRRIYCELQEAARRWLLTPQRALVGAIPLEIAKTEVGAREGEQIIGRLEQGVFT